MVCCDFNLQNLIRSSVRAGEYSISFIEIVQAIREISWLQYLTEQMDEQMKGWTNGTD